MNAPYNMPPQVPNIPIQPNNPMLNAFGGYQNFMNSFNSFVQTIQQDPRQLAQQYMNSGQMTPQMFEQYRQQANAMLGMNL